MEKCISLGGLRIFPTRCMLRDACRPCPSCRFVQFVRIVPMWFDPLSNGEMHLIRGTKNISNYAQHAVCGETLVRALDSFDSYESCPCDTTRCRMEKYISLAGLRLCPTRCMQKDACPSCRFVRFVRIVPMWYDPLSNREMHLIRGTKNISNTL